MVSNPLREGNRKGGRAHPRAGRPRPRNKIPRLLVASAWNTGVGWPWMRIVSFSQGSHEGLRNQRLVFRFRVTSTHPSSGGRLLTRAPEVAREKAMLTRTPHSSSVTVFACDAQRPWMPPWVMSRTSEPALGTCRSLTTVSKLWWLELWGSSALGCEQRGPPVG